MNFPKNLTDMSKVAAQLSIKFDIFGLKITLGITVFKFLEIYQKTAIEIFQD